MNQSIIFPSEGWEFDPLNCAKMSLGKTLYLSVKLNSQTEKFTSGPLFLLVLSESKQHMTEPDDYD